MAAFFIGSELSQALFAIVAAMGARVMCERLSLTSKTFVRTSLIPRESRRQALLEEIAGIGFIGEKVNTAAIASAVFGPDLPYDTRRSVQAGGLNRRPFSVRSSPQGP